MEESESTCENLENSCKTIVLKDNFLFISAFPGKIIFGDITNYKYPKFKSFQFNVFQLFFLYVSFVNIITKVIAEENTESFQSEGVIIKLSEDLQYLWSIKKKMNKILKI